MAIDERKSYGYDVIAVVQASGSIVIEMHERCETEGVEFGWKAHGYNLYEQCNGQIDHSHMLVLGYVEPTYIDARPLRSWPLNYFLHPINSNYFSF